MVIRGNDLLLVNPTVLSVYDAYVSSNYPDNNTGTATALDILLFNKAPPDADAINRTFIRANLSGFSGVIYMIYLYCHVTANIRVIDVYEVSASWGETEITWNNKPSLGRLITTFSPTLGTWHGLSTNGAHSLCLKFHDESMPEEGAGNAVQASFNSQQSHLGNHPYFLGIT